MALVWQIGHYLNLSGPGVVRGEKTIFLACSGPCRAGNHIGGQKILHSFTDGLSLNCLAPNAVMGTILAYCWGSWKTALPTRN